MNTITTQIQKFEYTIINKLSSLKKKKLGASDIGERERNERIELIDYIWCR